MSSPGRLLRSVELDTFGVAVGTALVAGALSVVASFLVALTGTLAALAVASWAMLRSQEAPSWRALLPGLRAAGVGILAVGAGVFLLPPPPLVPVRGLLLAVTLLPLWWVEHRRPAGRPVRERRP